MQTIQWSDFTQIELRVGKIIDVHDFPEARCPAYQLSRCQSCSAPVPAGW